MGPPSRVWSAGGRWNHIGVGEDSDVTIAGIETTLYSNQAGTLLVANVPLNDAHTVQVAIENAPAGTVSEILNSIAPMTEAEWTIAVDAQTSPTTTEVVQLDGN